MQEFNNLAAVWHKETGYMSSMDQAAKHPAYQEIINLGSDVIPLLLRDMEENHNHWFTALEKLTGVRPTNQAFAGNVPKMIEAWLSWAKEHGYQW